MVASAHHAAVSRPPVGAANACPAFESRCTRISTGYLGRFDASRPRPASLRIRCTLVFESVHRVTQDPRERRQVSPTGDFRAWAAPGMRGGAQPLATGCRVTGPVSPWSRTLSRRPEAELELPDEALALANPLPEGGVLGVELADLGGRLAGTHLPPADGARPGRTDVLRPARPPGAWPQISHSPAASGVCTAPGASFGPGP